jgi:hypothetical protein
MICHFIFDYLIVNESKFFADSVTIVQTFEVFWVNYQASSIIVPSYDVYHGCGITKACFGIPAFCVPNRNCDMVSAVTYDNPGFTFELLSTGKYAWSSKQF